MEARPRVTVVDWSPDHDAALAGVIQRHSEVDPTYPAQYARGGDGLAWLAATPDMARAVAVVAHGGDEVPVGHGGLATVGAAHHAAELWCGALGVGPESLCEVVRVVVDPAWRRCGVATALADHLEARAVGSGRIPVVCQLADRHGARAMRLARGWRVVGTLVGPRSGREILALVPGPDLAAAASA